MYFVFCITKGRDSDSVWFDLVWTDSVDHRNTSHFHPTSVATVLRQSLQSETVSFELWLFWKRFFNTFDSRQIIFYLKPGFISQLCNDPGRDSNAGQKAAYLIMFFFCISVSLNLCILYLVVLNDGHANIWLGFL